MRKSIRFWLIYSVAWLPYAASYMSLFITHLGRTFFGAIKGSILNVLPAALLGIGVVAVSQRIPWSPNRRYRFLLAHVVWASLYVVLWMNAVPFLNAMGRLIQSGPWTFRREGSFQRGFFTGLLIYVTIAGIVYAVQTTERLRAEQARATRAESLRTRAELEALRAQLNPHFLFNTLHSLMALVRHDPLAAEDALEKLALLLRHTLMTNKDADDVELSDELDFVENYLSLERLRLGDRLRIERKIQTESLPCRLPPFTLQPLIENSIKHAISTQPHGGLLQIKAERRNGILSVEVIDDGPGAKLEDVEASNGIGIRIVRQRLMTRYGDRANFRLETGPGEGFSVRMEIPTNARIA
ncbi:MAG TPA: histidine kinase [Pyrinomonadaceae bacterium]|nr:histidine kinase [Pyrinomonadaceae bacterium]